MVWFQFFSLECTKSLTVRQQQVINSAGIFGAGPLHRLGLGSPYHPTTPTASATGPSGSSQPDFSQYRQPSTGLVQYSPFPPTQPLVNSPVLGVVGGDWQRPPHPYSNDVSPALSSLSSNSYAAAQHTNSTDPYMGDFVSAQAMDQGAMNSTPQQPSFEYYPWHDGTMNIALSPSSAGSLASPIMSAGGGVSEQAADSIVYGGGEMDGYSEQQQLQRTDTMAATSSRSPSFVPPNAPPSSKPKLRSASRTSKNLQARPDETPRERKSRNSHNLVEKQYRNRLNLQFESLMSALPESMKNSVASGGGTSEGLSEGLDIGERKLSKAQVLDMSTRYIKSLEKDRETLERENGELVRAMERLRDMLEKEQEEKRGSGDYDGHRGGGRGERGGGGAGYVGT
ncbi:hypothetical protein QBC44DRAFT_5151 [Cladorrhinum sp. PSN332]|nr:hypothetical protein QBC44DRAFT_5151 [Cladorrhinum sp. PSN332]